MKLHELAPPKGAKKSRKRLGRGPGSGHGKTAGKGHKGQNARSGGKTVVGFEGGQMPLQRRLPKRGFANIFRKQYAVINVRDLERFETGVEVDAKLLRDMGLVSGSYDGIKILGHGELSKAVTVKADKWSQSAAQKIINAGGSIQEP
jgi:large subunit ribosomal protein L15